MATNQMRREAAKRKLANQQKRREEQARRRKRNTTIAAVATVVVVIAAGIGVYLYASAPAQLGPDTSAMPTAPLPTRPQALPASVNCSYPAAEPAAKPVSPPANGPVTTNGTVAAALDTSAGPIDMTLDRSLAPCTVNSFVNLAQKGYFNDTSCHRLSTRDGLQMLQCGDPTGQGTGGPGYTVPDEVFPQLTYGRGLVAMANKGQPNSGGSQFFLIYGSAQLPPQYTVFGSIGSTGLDTLDAVARRGDDGSLDPSPGGGKPLDPVTISSVSSG